MQGSEWHVPLVALLHTWVIDGQCRFNPLWSCYLSHTHWGIIIIIIIILLLLLLLLYILCVGGGDGGSSVVLMYLLNGHTETTPLLLLMGFEIYFVMYTVQIF